MAMLAHTTSIILESIIVCAKFLNVFLMMSFLHVCTSTQNLLKFYIAEVFE